ncbi:hypothetical protein CBM2634_U90006 [Cupriavidus taiwanensis]|uniref:Uncharacterized protein n=1 Tax=Cupriavidus taiwanensis TaxID=164546 RepID=A0A375JD44_9BURK|nr:hypothetical protein CBM2634_U90006 [Cupriavidus taiwanensis]
MELLRAFGPQDDYLGNAELSRLPYTLATLGYLTYIEATEKYRLGQGAMVLGHRYVGGAGIREIAQPLMQSLAFAAGGQQRGAGAGLPAPPRPACGPGSGHGRRPHGLTAAATGTTSSAGNRIRPCTTPASRSGCWPHWRARPAPGCREGPLSRQA